jgi:HAD superfamily hydrolase (TIGR01490 family)
MPPTLSRTRIAVFDVDGTLIDGQTQILFARYIVERGGAPRALMMEIAGWYLLYRLGVRLPVARIQRRMVRAFTGTPTDVMHAVLDAFTAEILAHCLRPEALCQIRTLRRGGAHVVLVSASLDLIINRLAQLVDADGVVATRVTPSSDGRFSGRIDGKMIYGAAKLEAVRHYANQRFPEWEFNTAYGDHESDRFLLAAAQRAFAVNPDRRLERIARRRGWPIVHWPVQRIDGPMLNGDAASSRWDRS